MTECSKWGLFTRPLTENWGRGRIQLIGDAAHAMLPNAGQGACQAFEDAYILARWLDACRDPVEAFANFRRIRIPRVHGGAAALARQCPLQAHARRRGAKDSIAAGKGSVHGTAEWVWGYDPVSEWDKEPVVPSNLRRRRRAVISAARSRLAHDGFRAPRGCGSVSWNDWYAVICAAPRQGEGLRRPDEQKDLRSKRQMSGLALAGLVTG